MPSKFQYRRPRSSFLQIVAVIFIVTFMPVSAQAGMIVSSLEQYNYQTGSGLVIRSFDAFDEIDGFPDVTGLSVQVNNGPVENIPFNPDYNAFKRGQSWASVAEMVAARPIDATITHTLQGSPAGSVSITSPGIAYADGISNSPLLTIVGATGFWTTGSNGQGIFVVAPSTNSFSINMIRVPNSAKGGAAVAPAPYFANSVWVSEGGEHVDALQSGLLVGGSAAPTFSLTFTRGLPVSGGDADAHTYGFGDGSFFHLEGEVVRIMSLDDAGLGDGSQKAFVFQNNTGLDIMIMSVPEPAAYVLMLCGVLVVAGVANKHR